MIRVDHPDVIYKTEEAKFNAVIEDIAERHATGQPVLVGTVSVENSEILSQLLRRRGIPHSVLNAKFHAKEAQIIAQAGRKGAVTVATNMAGRGTDIMLGGNPRPCAEEACASRGLDPIDTPDEYEALGGGRPLRKPRSRSSTTRSSTPAVSTSSAPSGTSRAASTTSCAAVPAARATPASPGSTCPSRTT